VRVARALAGSPESSAVWLPTTFRRSAFATTLAYRGRLREAAAALRPDLAISPRLLTELALFGAEPVDTANHYFDRWLRAGDVRNSQAGLSWWAARGDARAILRFQHVADSVARSSPNAVLREEAVFGGQAAQAYLALVRHDTADALRRFEQLPDSLCAVCYFESLMRQRLHAARGEDRTVLEESEPTYDLPRLGEVSRALEGARAAERLGERARAMRAYQFVADAWRHADPELQPYVTEARQALQGLAGEPRP
jgi:hypothetical protein